MPAHETHHPCPPTDSLPTPAGHRGRDLDALLLLVVALTACLQAVQFENQALVLRVQELTLARDDLLDAADIHSLCAHEERLIGLVQFYDRLPRVERC
ncbi:MAG: hypothetical protein JWN03_3235 [Nocardia sp.]|uniref:hypothetical protein n=1 Tax=Nocardia sp. TaxID=1821 RepID=UPI00260CF6D6|nr:hypothetical protein [Nocardia sp.]MCU1642960.1 hypothetical protein [Nocardia sp.]